MPVSDLDGTPETRLSVLQAILDTTVDGLITIDDQGHILSFNNACQTIFGYSAEEVIGKNVSCLMPPPYRAEHDGYVGRYNAGGEARIIGIGREVHGLRKDGSIFPLDLAVAKVEAEGRVLYSGIVRDITQRKQAEDKITRQNEELGRFAYMASHDLKEPLRSIEAFADLLSLEYADQLDEDGQSYLGILMSSASRLRDVVNDVLEYSRLEADNAPPTEIDTAELMKQIVSEMSQQLKASEGSITFSNSLPLITEDRVRFYRLMQNLIANALKYCPEDRAPRINVSAAARDQLVEFRVQDNGIGIAPEYRSSVFEMFKRLHTRDAYSGTGIGLAICRRIVENWGGDIWVESAPGNGSVFCFTIPAIKVNMAPEGT